MKLLNKLVSKLNVRLNGEQEAIEKPLELFRTETPFEVRTSRASVIVSMEVSDEMVKNRIDKLVLKQMKPFITYRVGSVSMPGYEGMKEVIAEINFLDKKENEE